MKNLDTPSSLSVLKGQNRLSPPIWLMRQAGRYQKSYRSLRENYSFSEMYHTPELATLITTNAIKEFNFDISIIFSDILVIPEALNLPLHFGEKGPVFEKRIICENDLKIFPETSTVSRLSYVYEAIKQTKKELPPTVPLLGFAGAPLTLACYMITGKSDNFSLPRRIMVQNPLLFDSLMDRLTDEVAEHLIAQLQNGADAVQIFDSLIDILPFPFFEKYALQPLQKIINKIRQISDAPIILFSKATSFYAEDYLKAGVSVLSFSQHVSLRKNIQTLPKNTPIQGNFPPEILALDPSSFQSYLKTYLEDITPLVYQRPYIFNLGHGVLPYTPETNVHHLIQTVRNHFETSSFNIL